MRGVNEPVYERGPYRPPCCFHFLEYKFEKNRFPRSRHLIEVNWQYTCWSAWLPRLTIIKLNPVFLLFSPNHRATARSCHTGSREGVQPAKTCQYLPFFCLRTPEQALTCPIHRHITIPPPPPPHRPHSAGPAKCLELPNPPDLFALASPDSDPQRLAAAPVLPGVGTLAARGRGPPCRRTAPDLKPLRAGARGSGLGALEPRAARRGVRFAAVGEIRGLVPGKRGRGTGRRRTSKRRCPRCRREGPGRLRGRREGVGAGRRWRW